MLRLIIFLTFLCVIPKISTQQNQFGPQISSLFRRPFQSPPIPQPCAIGTPPAQCPPPILPTPTSPGPVPGCEAQNVPVEEYRTKCKEYMTSLTTLLPKNFRDPFVSDFDPAFTNISHQIADKILEISGASQLQQGFNQDGGQQNARFPWCRVATVAYIMRDSPLMNYKFWQRAFYKIIQSRPELRNSMESNPLQSFEGFFSAVPQEPSWMQARPQFTPTPGVECPGQLGESYNMAENSLWYFREDIEMNDYHDLWHLQNPLSPFNRQGELFYYFHRNLLARYNTERVTHSIPAAPGLIFASSSVLNPGYDPRNGFSLRRPNAPVPSGLGLFINEIQNMETFAASKSSFRTSSGHSADEVGRRVDTQIALIGDSVHGNGHGIIGSMSITGGNSVMMQLLHAMRDPIFYQWHGYVDSIVHKHKNALPSYQVATGELSLSWNNIAVRQVSVATATPPGLDTLHTFWRNRVRGSSCRKELDHEDFTFNLNIENNGGSPVWGTVRIFLAPSKGADGRPLTLVQQQDLFFVLEVFNKYFLPGPNTISRSSTKLSTTAPRWNDPIIWQKRRAAGEIFTEIHCGCGHPHNLLLPMGTDCPGGEEFDLIVLVTDATKYKFHHSEGPRDVCHVPPVLCGIQEFGKLTNRPYVDADLPMGYPFDRHWRTSGFTTIASLGDRVGNMAVKKINIIHHDNILEEGQNWSQLPWKPATSRRCGGPPPPPPPECWYDYNGVQCCDPVPPGYECTFQYGLKYCKPITIVPTPDPCWYDYSGSQHCYPIPPGCHCTDYNQMKYCDVTVTTTTQRPIINGCYPFFTNCHTSDCPTNCYTPPTNCYYNHGYQICTTPRPDCYYDQYMTRSCDPPPTNYDCHYTNGYKQCQPPAANSGYGYGWQQNYGYNTGAGSYGYSK